MASPEEITPSSKKKDRKARRLTVMVMRDVGGVRSFKISSRFFVCVSLFFIAFIVLSIFAINAYLDLRLRYDDQSESLAACVEANNRRDRELKRAMGRIALLEDYARDLEGRLKEKVQVARENVSRPKAEPKEQKKDTSSPPPPKPAPKLVDVRDVSVKRENSQITVEFKLVNLRPGQAPVGGYVYVLAVAKGIDPPLYSIHPEVKLKDGIPANYKKGQPFFIQRFKPMKARFNLSRFPTTQAVIQVLVYDQKGKILLKKDFEADNAT
ncbi:MAG: hypothetical protein JRJ01_05670 [Deltaproteobacteria bacterium]|nr:hypothetical protein [Deltaproteobacteria bacterium]